MTLKEGHIYKRRDGRITGPLIFRENDDENSISYAYPFVDPVNATSYMESGLWFPTFGEQPNDLVEELDMEGDLGYHLGIPCFVELQ